MTDPKGTDIRISVHDARERQEAGDALMLDVVQPGAWDSLDSVVEGSVRIEPAELLDRFEELPRERDVIAYCT
jgi:rhodanese-related sulfurtransferase